MQDEGHAHSEQDLKQMLHRLGLVGRIPCYTLITLHTAMQASAPLHPPPLADLLKVGSLTVQQLERGVDVRTSIGVAATEVYVCGQMISAVRQVRCAV